MLNKTLKYQVTTIYRSSMMQELFHSKHVEKVVKVFFDVIIVYMLHFKHDDFTWKSVRFNDEMLRFKGE